MRFSFTSAVLLLTGVAHAASWTFSDGAVTISSKKAESQVHKFTNKQKLTQTVSWSTGETLKVALTAQEGSKSKRPHQAFLMIKESSGLEAPFALKTKDSGKGSVELGLRDLPYQLLNSPEPLQASLVLASFGSSSGFSGPVFDITIQIDPAVAPPKAEEALRYGKLPEIHHIFRADPKNPPKIVSAVFALAVVATIPGLFIAWAALGANTAHLTTALGAAPVSHVVFFGSIVAMEGVFFLYYSSWNLFQTLPAAGIVGVAAFLSGSKALGEVRSRRLAGER